MAQVEKRASNLPATFEWEYAPAPEARDIVSLATQGSTVYAGTADGLFSSSDGTISVSSRRRMPFSKASWETVALVVPRTTSRSPMLFNSL